MELSLIEYLVKVVQLLWKILKMSYLDETCLFYHLQIDHSLVTK
ncbi:hypothetical protein Gotri_003414 [Gossypium trilobum]|uniref:Uncharacterized protein n=1 Tax=Gossypium trilobum TaxID=34281 RepID=A0A7J9F3E3_9ROSI|nr:hypothetical protein [Gossypium trilobum]